ncbi:MAG: peptidyl-tRNA hydrolase Pth2 [Nitrososphaerales archaeon]
MKQVIVVRKDLKMGKGKLASQVSHASLTSALLTKEKKARWFKEWWNKGQAKIVLRVDSLEELMSLKKKADELNLINTLIQDKGLTQLEEGTTTCLAIGPAPDNIIDKVTGKLKLL